MTRPRILLVAQECPWPADIGLKNHLLQLVEDLTALSELHVCGFYSTLEERDRWAAFALRTGFALRGLVRHASGARLTARRIRCLAEGRPLVEARFDTAALQPLVQAALHEAESAGSPFHWLAFELFPTLMDVDAGPGTRQVLFPVDCYSLYYRRIRQRAAHPGEWLRSAYLSWACGGVERRRYKDMDLVVTVAETDARALRAQSPGLPVEVLPVPVGARPVRKPLSNSLRRPRVLVCGYFGMPTIARDAQRFLKAWQNAAGHQPAADLVVWGRDARRAGLEPYCRRAGAELIEWTGDYDGLLASADVYVYPQRFACGVQTKLQQAMRAGLAVVAGREALEPLAARDGRHACWTRDPEDAARALRDLLKAGPEAIDALGRSAQSLMSERFSREHIRGELARMLGFAGHANARVRSREEEDANAPVLYC